MSAECGNVLQFTGRSNLKLGSK